MCEKAAEGVVSCASVTVLLAVLCTFRPPFFFFFFLKMILELYTAQCPCSAGLTEAQSKVMIFRSAEPPQASWPLCGLSDNQVQMTCLGHTLNFC